VIPAGGTRRKLLTLGVVLLAAALFFALGLHRYLTLDFFKARQQDLRAAFDAHPFWVAGAFVAIKVTALSLSLPGAVLTMSLAAGAIFGPVWGTALCLFAVTMGDSLSFLIARYVLRDWVERRFGRYMGTIDRGIERDGAFYLLSLRLMAVVPFFVVNLTMGLTRMPLKVFAPVSFLGLIPATTLYVNAGTQLGQIERPSDIYSPELVLSFVALGLLPIVARFVLRRFQPAAEAPNRAS
jgi:uncharacterized membrane protein YdjX (TVP38/TMEM64 family)